MVRVSTVPVGFLGMLFTVEETIVEDHRVVERHEMRICSGYHATIKSWQRSARVFSCTVKETEISKSFSCIPEGHSLQKKTSVFGASRKGRLAKEKTRLRRRGGGSRERLGSRQRGGAE